MHVAGGYRSVETFENVDRELKPVLIGHGVRTFVTRAEVVDHLAHYRVPRVAIALIK